MSNATTSNALACVTHDENVIPEVAAVLLCLTVSKGEQNRERTDKLHYSEEKFQSLPSHTCKQTCTHARTCIHTCTPHTHTPGAALLHPAGPAQATVHSAFLSSPSGFPSPATAPFAASLSEGKQISSPFFLKSIIMSG